jgi:DNA polymerase (family 10)
VISSDAHAISELEFPRWGVLVARRAWATTDDVLNAQPLAAFKRGLKRGR